MEPGGGVLFACGTSRHSLDELPIYFLEEGYRDG